VVDVRRTIFIVYLAVIFGGLAYFVLIGLMRI